MGSIRWSVLVALSLISCKREIESEPHASMEPPASVAARDAARDAGLARAIDPAPTWYRAMLRTTDGIEMPFLFGLPAPGAPGQVTFRVGGHDVQSAATFDGTSLKVPLPIHQTSVEATIAPDGTLRGTFTTAGRAATGASSTPITGTKIATPTMAALATVGTAGVALDLGEPRTVWRLAMKDSGLAKLVLEQVAPGELTGMLFLDTGNIVYVAGNARGDTAVLSGFDGTSGARLALALAADHAHAQGTFIGGEHLDWRETLTATRGPEFTLEVEPKPTRPGAKVGFPNQPELAALPPGPLLVEISASWCSTCRSAAPFLVELAHTYQPRGLGMVTLLYDLIDDRAVSAKQAEAFKTTYGVTWPVVAISGGTDVLPEILPTGVVGLNPAGFPITLFLAADRTLVALHAGFPSPDARDDFRRVTAEFRANIETLLASPIDAHSAHSAHPGSAKATKD